MSPLGSRIRSPGAAPVLDVQLKRRGGAYAGGAGVLEGALSPQPETDPGCAQLLATHSRRQDAHLLPARTGRREGVRPQVGEEGEPSGQQTGEVVVPLPREALCTATWLSPLWSLCAGLARMALGPRRRLAGGHGLRWAAWVAEWTNPLCPEEGKDQ